MRQLFITVLSLSLSGTLIGLLLMIIHPATEKLFSKKWNYYIWLLVVVQLLLPLYALPVLSNGLHLQIDLGQMSQRAFGDSAKALPEINQLLPVIALPSSNASDHGETFPENVTASTGKPTQNDETAYYNNTDTQIAGQKQAAQSPSNDHSAAPDKTPSVRHPDFVFSNALFARMPFSAISLLTAAAYLWFFGMAAVLSIKLVRYYRFKSCMKKNYVRINDNRITILENTFCTQLHIQNVPALYESAAVSGPMTIGLLRPVIVLPDTFIDKSASADTASGLTKLQLVLHHELIHVARKDLLYKWLCQLVLCIHWFNPVLYRISRQINRDCELSCDETILAMLTENGRQLYGNILLDTAAHETDFRENAFSTTLLENKKDLKMRLDNILYYKKATRFRLVLSACAFIVMLMISACSTVKISANGTSVSENTSHSTDSSTVNLTSPSANSSTVNVASQSADSSTADVNTASQSADSSTAATEADNASPSPAALPSLHHTESSLPDTAALHTPDTKSDRSADAQKAYHDDKLLAGDDIQVSMGAYNYMGGNHKVQASHLFLYGSYTLISAYAEQDIDVRIKTSFAVTEGKFKIVLIAPDGSIVTLNETGEETWQTITMKEGRNVIKMVGLEAHLKNLVIDYSDLKETDFEKIYYSEGEEYCMQILDTLATGEPVNKDKFLDGMIYLNAADVSEAFNALLSSGITFTDDELCDIFLYSDETLSSQYLLDAIQSGNATSPSGETISELMPYLTGDCQTELLKSLTVEEFFDVFAENIVYLNDGQINECLTDYLGKGGTLTYSMYSEISPFLSQGMRQKLDKHLLPSLP